ncbi:unnamed protein product [Moneuplotes crassus]|uniref:Uncharacterized protein n=1 Tax=Euplotes crassus TaxID=5936 RepID=A0AAD1Y0C6_EUPCR|nr:unnamed protein product [Moneuplotes crassus]
MVNPTPKIKDVAKNPPKVKIKSKSIHMTSKKRQSMLNGDKDTLQSKASEMVPKTFKRATTLYHGFDATRKIISQNMDKSGKTDNSQKDQKPTRKGHKEFSEIKPSGKFELEEKYVVPQQEISDYDSQDCKDIRDKYSFREKYEEYRADEQYSLNKQF